MCVEEQSKEQKALFVVEPEDWSDSELKKGSRDQHWGGC